ncbi:MAG TPA: alanyl-tRNA editing protein [Clostridiales bacterium]|nr:alanyl-tRNA editing protein [Clostridiales bacterium]
MTIKLYDSDAYLSEFEATVREVTEKNGHYEILLDRTAFFPEEGGQSADTGTLGDVSVIGGRISDGEIFHLTDAPLAVGAKVTGRVNFAERYDKMKQHTAEHILSGLFFSHFGYHNIGFHLGAEETTMDFDGVPTREELDRIETLANEAVMQNLRVTAEYPPTEVLESLNYRSKLALTENVRIVTIEGVDVCACCAPHVAHTGEIGCIKILDAEKYKGGIRLHMKAGLRALADYRMRYRTTAALSALLSEKQTDLVPATEKLLADTAALTRTYRELKLGLMKKEGEDIPPTDKNLVRVFSDASYDELRAFANAAMEKVGGMTVALAPAKEGYSYLIAVREGDLSGNVREINAALAGKGGGRGNMVMGTFRAGIETIRRYFEEENA